MIQFNEFVTDSRRCQYSEVSDKQSDVVRRGIVDSWVTVLLCVRVLDGRKQEIEIGGQISVCVCVCVCVCNVELAVVIVIHIYSVGKIVLV